MIEKTEVRTREIVVDILLEMEGKKRFSHHMIRDVLQKYDYLRGQEKAFIKRLAEGTLERRIELDYLLDQISSVPVRKMKPFIRSLLRVGTYQILYMDSVPDSAACNEAVKLAGKRGFHNLKGFVNVILRKISAGKENLSYPDQEKEPVLYLSVKYSMPEWIVRYWLDLYGKEKTEKILQGLLEERPVTLRFTAEMGKDRIEEWTARVREKGVEVTPHPYLSYAVCIRGMEGITSLPGYEEGWFTVQDISSMLAVEAAGIVAGDFVLDVCSAPGGKTMLAAERVSPGGKVEARDVSEQKIDLIKENIRRMRLQNVTVKIWDATVTDEGMEERADVVLADVPCSGLGVIGRKQDIKYNATEQSLRDLTVLQKEILKTCASYVKKGGVLLYSTCTINPAENEEMAEWICRELGFRPESIEESLPQVLQGETGTRGYIQLLPGVHQSDGFFFAKLRRNG